MIHYSHERREFLGEGRQVGRVLDLAGRKKRDCAIRSGQYLGSENNHGASVDLRAASRRIAPEDRRPPQMRDQALCPARSSSSGDELGESPFRAQGYLSQWSSLVVRKHVRRTCWRAALSGVRPRTSQKGATREERERPDRSRNSLYRTRVEAPLFDDTMSNGE